MKHILAGLIASMGFVITASAVGVTDYTTFPSPNGSAWTYQKDAALAWGTANNAITVVIVGDSVGCGKCKTFDTRTLSSTKWDNFVKTHNLALVYWNKASPINYNTWLTWASANAVGGLFPTVNVFGPGGKRLTNFLARDSKSFPDHLITVLTPYVAQYPGKQPPGTIGFAASALTVAEDAGSVSVVVNRTGGSYGAQSFRVQAAAHPGTNAAVNEVVAWTSGDSASKMVNVPLVADDGKWTEPTERVFTVTLSKVSGEATLGRSALTVTVLESTPYAPGEIGFTSDAAMISETDTPYQAFVTRTNGSVGAVSVSYSVLTNGFQADSGTLSWADAEMGRKPINLSGVLTGTDDYYDGINTDVRIELSGLTGTPVPTWGELFETQTIEFRDELITHTLPEYTAAGGIATFSAENNEWFYNEDEDVMMSAPLANGAQSVLTFTASDYGLLTVAFVDSTTGAGTVTVASGVESSNSWTTVCLALNADDEVSWTAVATADGYAPQVKVVSWLPLVAPSGPVPADGSSFLLNEFDSKTLDWVSSVPVSVTNVFSVGLSTNSLFEVDVANGVFLSNASIAKKEGTVYWCIDFKADGDLGTSLMMPGPVWSFTIFDKPKFENNDLSKFGNTATVFTKTDVNINASASRAVIYEADFGALGGSKGLTINRTTGLISGTPSKAGTYPVTVRAYDSAGRMTSVTFNITVTKMTAAKYNGVVMNGDLPTGTMTLSQSTTGRATAKLVMGGTSTSLKAMLQSKGDGSMIAKLAAAKGTVVDVVLVSGGMTGTIAGQSAGIVGQLAAKGLASGYYTATVVPNSAAVYSSGTLGYRPEGYGYLTVTAASGGTARYAGILPDGSRISGSTPRFNALQINSSSYYGLAIYKVMYMKRGAVSLLVPLTSSTDAVKGEWNYPGKLTREDALHVQLMGVSAPYVKSLGLASLNGKTASSTGLESAVVTVTARAMTAKSADLQLKGNANTGVISGKAGRISIKGVAIQTTGMAGGQYLIPHPADKRFKQSCAVTVQ